MFFQSTKKKKSAKLYIRRIKWDFVKNVYIISYSDIIYKMQYNQYHISLLLENTGTTANNIKKVIMLLEKMQ